MSLNYNQEQKLIDKIIEMAMNSRIVYGLDYFETEETKNTMKQCEKDINKSIKKLKLLLDDEGKRELENLIDMLEQLDNIRTRNSFNNGARTGLVELDFLKEYFKVF
ncbi:TPA: hypothetical protein K8N61_003054 [Clostridium perfringens]|nr:hypothetical protein [Clostridium perfringens]HBI6922962.1 hypothetical protein [Clostridium perfringens]